MTSSHQVIDVNIQESRHVNDVLKFCSYNSLVAFDLDNTVMRPTHVEDLGSDQWFAHLYNWAKAVLNDCQQARTLALALTEHIQKLIDIKPVEVNTPKIIQRLQDVKIPVLGLTARNISSDTFAQLNKINVSFTKYSPGSTIKLNVPEYPDRQVYYQDGVIFCDGADKGKCLIEFFKQLKLKYNVVMVDDVRKNLLHVENAVTQLGLRFFGLRYGKTDGRVSRYDMHRSVKKLFSITQTSLFPSSEKETVIEIIAKLRLDQYISESISLKM